MACAYCSFLTCPFFSPLELLQQLRLALSALLRTFGTWACACCVARTLRGTLSSGGSSTWTAAATSTRSWGWWSSLFSPPRLGQVKSLSHICACLSFRARGVPSSSPRALDNQLPAEQHASTLHSAHMSAHPPHHVRTRSGDRVPRMRPEARRLRHRARAGQALARVWEAAQHVACAAH